MKKMRWYKFVGAFPFQTKYEKSYLVSSIVNLGRIFWILCCTFFIDCIIIIFLQFMIMLMVRFYFTFMDIKK